MTPEQEDGQRRIDEESWRLRDLVAKGKMTADDAAKTIYDFTGKVHDEVEEKTGIPWESILLLALLLACSVAGAAKYYGVI